MASTEGNARKGAGSDAKGYSIPIEDAQGSAEGSATDATPEENAAAENDSVKEAGSDPQGSEAAAPKDSTAEPDAAEKAEKAEDAEDANEDDIVAEAEAVVNEVSADDLEAARKDAAEWQDRYLRLHAEWDTYRRRTSEQRAEEKARATEKLVSDMLPVLDDFERTIAYAESNGEGGLLDGVRAVHNKMLDVLIHGGVEVIDPAGQPFDAIEQQAVGTVDNTEEYDETVAQVYQKGYRMGKKVLRPAMVTITSGGPKRPKEDDGDNGGNDEETA